MSDNASTKHNRAEREPAAQDAPVGRPLSLDLQAHQIAPLAEMIGMTSPIRNTVVVRSHARQPAAEPGDGERADRQREPAQDLHHAEIVVDVRLRPRRAVGVRARHDLGAHGIGDDVLQHDAEHDQ